MTSFVLCGKMVSSVNPIKERKDTKKMYKSDFSLQDGGVVTTDPQHINKGVILDKPGVEPCVDYLTATSNKAEIFERWSLAIRSATRSHLKRGQFEVREKRWKMYQGEQYGPGIYVGHSLTQGVIVRCSGAWANVLWPLIVPGARRVSRLDLAVTALLEKKDVDVARNHYYARPDDNKRIYSNIVNSRGGTTTYVGSFNSEQSGRVYDKGAQLGAEPGWLWRYEVMLRNLKSLAQARSLYESWAKDGPVGSQVRGYVYGWFKLRGVTPIWEKGAKIERLQDVKLEIDTHESRLTWLSNAVRPAIARLILDGFREDAEKALGFRLEPRDDCGMRLLEEEVGLVSEDVV